MIWIRRILLTYVFLAVFAAATGIFGAAPRRPTHDSAAACFHKKQNKWFYSRCQ